MNKTRGFISIALAIVISVIAVAMVAVGIYYKLESDQLVNETNANQVVNNNTNVNSQCIGFTLPEICTTLYVPGYYYDKNSDGCIFDGNGCTKPYATLKECTQSCASRTIAEDDGVAIKQTCGNVIVYNVEAGNTVAPRQDCQTRGGVFKECDSPCGSLLTVCRMSCTL